VSPSNVSGHFAVNVTTRAYDQAGSLELARPVATGAMSGRLVTEPPPVRDVTIVPTARESPLEAL